MFGLLNMRVMQIDTKHYSNLVTQSVALICTGIFTGSRCKFASSVFDVQSNLSVFLQQKLKNEDNTKLSGTELLG